MEMEMGESHTHFAGGHLLQEAFESDALLQSFLSDDHLVATEYGGNDGQHGLFHSLASSPLQDRMLLLESQQSINGGGMMYHRHSHSMPFLMEDIQDANGNHENTGNEGVLGRELGFDPLLTMGDIMVQTTPSPPPLYSNNGHLNSNNGQAEQLPFGLGDGSGDLRYVTPPESPNYRHHQQQQHSAAGGGGAVGGLHGRRRPSLKNNPQSTTNAGAGLPLAAKLALPRLTNPAPLSPTSHPNNLGGSSGVGGGRQYALIAPSPHTNTPSSHANNNTPLSSQSLGFVSPAVLSSASPSTSSRDGRSSNTGRQRRNSAMTDAQNGVIKRCYNCLTYESPQWRHAGGDDPRVLCNACGIRFKQHNGAHRDPLTSGKHSHQRRSSVLHAASPSNGRNDAMNEPVSLQQSIIIINNNNIGVEDYCLTPSLLTVLRAFATMWRSSRESGSELLKEMLRMASNQDLQNNTNNLHPSPHSSASNSSNGVISDDPVLSELESLAEMSALLAEICQRAVWKRRRPSEPWPAFLNNYGSFFLTPDSAAQERVNNASGIVAPPPSPIISPVSGQQSHSRASSPPPPTI